MKQNPCYSDKIKSHILKIYEKLTGMFSGPTPTPNNIERALTIMNVITPLTKDETIQKSYDLFRAAMRVPTSQTYPYEKQMEIARVAMQGAYKCNKSLLPPVEDLDNIIKFAKYHFFRLAKPGNEEYLKATMNALCALVYDPGTDTLTALRDEFLAKPGRFVHTTAQMLLDNNPPKLHKVVFLLLSHVSKKLFSDDGGLSTDPNVMGALCASCASAHAHLNPKDDVQEAALTVLFKMINSSRWLPHITEKGWKVLDLAAHWVSSDLPALRRCLDNSLLMERIRVRGRPGAATIWENMTRRIQSRLGVVAGRAGQARTSVN